VRVVLRCETVAWRGVRSVARARQAWPDRFYSSEDDKVSRLRLRFTLLRCRGLRVRWGAVRCGTVRYGTTEYGNDEEDAKAGERGRLVGLLVSRFSFLITLPVDSRCRVDTVPVYRLCLCRKPRAVSNPHHTTPPTALTVPLPCSNAALACRVCLQTPNFPETISGVQGVVEGDLWGLELAAVTMTMTTTTSRLCGTKGMRIVRSLLLASPLIGLHTASVSTFVSSRLVSPRLASSRYARSRSALLKLTLHQGDRRGRRGG
jgi:hypothetical protein